MHFGESFKMCQIVVARLTLTETRNKTAMSRENISPSLYMRGAILLCSTRRFVVEARFCFYHLVK